MIRSLREYPTDLVLELTKGMENIEIKDILDNFDSNITLYFNDESCALTEREKEYILLYFKENKTLQEIGKTEGLTRERVRQVIRTGILKLRNPTPASWYIYGASTVKLAREVDSKIKGLREKKIRLEIAIREIDNIINEVTSYNYHNTDASVDILDLSVRASNVLKNYKISTVGQLSLFSKEEIKNFKNSGVKTVNEICTKMSNVCGIRLKEYAYDYKQ